MAEPRLPAGKFVPESERLARRYFGLFNGDEPTRVLELMHPDVEIELRKTRPGEVLRGPADLGRFLEEISGTFYETVPEVFRPLDELRIVVEGRMRWMDDERVLRDDPMIWALEFRDGLLWRSLSAQSVLEAESLLAASPGS